MIKITPVNRLPYVKTTKPVDKERGRQINSNALSAEPQQNLHINKDLFGILHNTAGYKLFFGSVQSPHVASMSSAWKNRKNP